MALTLTPELEQAAAPVAVSPDIAGIGGASALAGPAPAPTSPAAPAAPTIPAVGSQPTQPENAAGPDALAGRTGVSSSFAEQLAKAQDRLGLTPGPGSWARNVLGAAQSVFSGASAVRPVPPGSGKLSGALRGIGDALNAQKQEDVAKQQRDMAAKKEAFEEARQMSAEDRAREGFRAQNMLDYVNIHTKLRDQTLKQREEQAALEKNLFDARIKNGGHAVQSNLTSDEIHELGKKKGVDYLIDKNYFQTGWAPVYGQDGKQRLDENGASMVRPLYSLVEGGSPTPVDKDFADKLKKFTNLKYTEGTDLDAEALQQAQTAVISGMKIQEDLNTAASKLKLSEQQLKDITDNPEKKAVGEQLAPYLERFGNDVGKTVDALTQSSQETVPAGQAGAGQPTPHAIEATNMLRQFNRYYGSEVVADAVKGTAALQLEKQKEAAKKTTQGVQTAEGDTSLRGQAYLDSVEKDNPGRAATLKLLSTGQMDLSSIQRTLTKNPGFIDELSLYDPTFNAPGIKAFMKNYVSYSGDGKTATAINAGGTAIDSLARLQALSTPAILIPGSKASKDYEQQLVTTATEVQKFLLGTGSPTAGETREMEEKLRAKLPINMGESARQQTRATIDKYNQYQDQWNSSQSQASSKWKFPMPTSWDKEIVDRANGLASGKTFTQPPNSVQTGHVNLNINAPGGANGNIPADSIQVQIPGQKPGYISKGALTQFQKDHPDAVVTQ